MKIFLFLLVVVFSFHLCVNQATKCRTLFDPVTLMDCSGMNLTSLDTNVLHVKNHTNVKKLIISQNKLNSSVTFKEWTTLISLDVSYNELSNISVETFGALSYIKLLNISYNHISTINESSFNDMPVLEILDLSGNPMLGTNSQVLQKSLDRIFFWSLKKFVMRASNLSSLPQDAFQRAHELQYLDLSDNHLTTIPALPDALVYFNANNNSIKTVDIVPFQKTKLLKDLYLENNMLLSDIDIDAFEKLKNVRNISFKGCQKLEYLPSRLFEFTRKLNFLSLADCNLTTLPHAYKSLFIKIPKLELQNNPWVCNVSIKWFILLESSHDENLRCGAPSNITITDYYGEAYHHSVLRKILIGLVFIVFILFWLALYISFTMEKKRKTNMPYVPLEGKNPLVNRVYVTTVV